MILLGRSSYWLDLLCASAILGKEIEEDRVALLTAFVERRRCEVEVEGWWGVGGDFGRECEDRGREYCCAVFGGWR